MKKIILGVLFFILIGGIALSLPVLAGTEGCPAGSADCLTNPLGTISTPQALIGRIINTVLGIVGSLALLMFVYGGLTWMTSSGSQEKIKKGRDIIVWSAIGLAIIFASYGIVKILLSSVK
ncbi:MAG: hypothetical protein ACYC40_03165 [Patescibacteria group bacterium]